MKKQKRFHKMIQGSIDDVIEVDGELVICDKKTTGSIEYFQKHNSSASDSHMAQINCYRALLNKCYGLDAKRGCVIYISNSISKEKYDKPTPISFLLKKPEEVLQEMIVNAKKIKESIKSDKLPERIRCYLCDGMCPYANKCFESFGED
jgi:CRISPR/Cas system-associated exonuclease Cas4 (RecB family)